MVKHLSPHPYKGTRDFYPEDMAVQRYIFDTWAYVAELYGYERYDASVLEPADLYKSKGAENEELVNEQTYTFLDRGDREVTLRPEMTPTAARMIAAKKRDLSFPVRWYSIPNLFRYERMQRGRLREHWQLNCDLFGIDDYTADVELITLAYNVMTAFGATDDMFEIRINDRAWITEMLEAEGLSPDQVTDMILLLDRKEKIDDFDTKAKHIAGKTIDFSAAPKPSSRLGRVIAGLAVLGITNVRVSLSTVRGFNYYTGVVFEIFDTSTENNRSIGGGGRYDNLTSLFGGDPVPGIGFGMGDVTMRDFLETHGLLTANITAPTLVVVPTEPEHNLEAERVAQQFRAAGVSATVDLGARKLKKKIAAASDALVSYVLVLGDAETATGTFTLKRLTDGTETSGTLEELVAVCASL